MKRDRAMRILLASTALLGLNAPALAQGELSYDFRGARFDDKRFGYDGPKELIHADDEGLRWRFLRGSAPTRPAGIYWKMQVRGDFAVTARYEILSISEPSTGSGVGPELYLMLD